MKRCHALRGVLELFDFDDASIDSLKKLLLRAAFAPAFLKPAEGRRFLSHLFTLHTGLTRELYAIVRNQIPTGAFSQSWMRHRAKRSDPHALFPRACAAA